MEKPAQTDFPLFAPIAKRWSPIAFSSRPLTGDDIGSLFEAARWAPSCFNEQPWYFFIARNDSPAEFKRMLDCLLPGNQVWARNAPLLVLTLAKLAFERNGKPNRHAWHDVGLAVENLVLQATSMGLIVHQMAGFDAAKVINSYDVLPGVEPVTAIAVGYPGNAAMLPDDLRKREAVPRSRKPLDTFLFTGKWGHNPEFLKE
jgi:nitroreductase